VVITGSCYRSGNSLPFAHGYRCLRGGRGSHSVQEGSQTISNSVRISSRRWSTTLRLFRPVWPDPPSYAPVALSVAPTNWDDGLTAGWPYSVDCPTDFQQSPHAECRS
jgi:hypothetical protein